VKKITKKYDAMPVETFEMLSSKSICAMKEIHKKMQGLMTELS